MFYLYKLIRNKNIVNIQIFVWGGILMNFWNVLLGNKVFEEVELYIVGYVM